MKYLFLLISFSILSSLMISCGKIDPEKIATASHSSIYVYDANGVKLGTVVMGDLVDVIYILNETTNALWLVKGTNGQIAVTSSGVAEDCQYESNDCSGQCYAKAGYPLPKNTVILGESSTFFKISSLSASTKVLQSHYNGACVPDAAYSASVLPTSQYNFPSGITYPIPTPLYFESN